MADKHRVGDCRHTGFAMYFANPYAPWLRERNGHANTRLACPAELLNDLIDDFVQSDVGM